MPKDTASSALTRLMDQVVPEYHISTQLGFHIDFLVLQNLLDVCDNALYSFLQENGIAMEQLCAQVRFLYLLLTKQCI